VDAVTVLKSETTRIGILIRSRRQSLSLSQSQLGKRIGVSAQQIQKYEDGFNTIGANRLGSLAAALSVPVGYFYPAQETLVSEPTPLSLVSDPANYDLVAAFSRIKDTACRGLLLQLAKKMANLAGEQAVVSAQLEQKV
jgi:transcriptional regulator with XRE-family HTH domain